MITDQIRSTVYLIDPVVVIGAPSGAGACGVGQE
jgi:hypothetical protein